MFAPITQLSCEVLQLYHSYGTGVLRVKRR